MNHRLRVIALAAFLCLAFDSSAQLFRAYLAPTGADTNPCTLAAPCRLLPAALAAVSNGGEIWLLDSANYNTATVAITKSVTLFTVPGATGSVVATGGPAISIGAGVTVTLRNLSIGPLPGTGGTHGIAITGGAVVNVEHCVIGNLGGHGIQSNAPGAVLRVADSTIRGNGLRGIEISGGTTATVVGSRIANNTGYGIAVLTAPGSATTNVATVTGSELSGNDINAHAWNQSPSGAARLHLDGNVITKGRYGVVADSGATTGPQYISLSRNVITENQIGIGNYFGAIESLGNNVLKQNGTPLDGNVVTIVAGF